MASSLQVVSPVVEQRDLEFIADCSAQIAELRRTRDKMCAAVLDGLLCGARVGLGDHTAELRSSRSGARTTFELLLDGRVVR